MTRNRMMNTTSKYRLYDRRYSFKCMLVVYSVSERRVWDEREAIGESYGRMQRGVGVRGGGRG